MKGLFELAGTVLLVCVLIFVFKGEPDLFDGWHALAVKATEPKPPCEIRPD